MDATRAATIARDHFEKVHGPYSVLGFQTIGIHNTDGVWQVTCSLYPSVGAREPLEYSVKVSDLDGAVLYVENVSDRKAREQNAIIKSFFGGLDRDKTINDSKDKNIEDERELSVRREDSVMLDKIATVIDGFRARKGDTFIELWNNLVAIRDLIEERNG